MTDKTLRSGTLSDIRIEAGTGQLYTPEGVPLPLSPTSVDRQTAVNVVEVVEGKPGERGKKGSDGRTILNGGRDPEFVADGVIGDFFLNTATMRMFGPKSQEGWGDGVSLLGSPGPRGLAGPPGSTILHGYDAPATDLGNEGDFYIDTTTGIMWGPKRADGWDEDDQISIRGRQGIKGDRGDVGADGEDGADGKTLLNGIGAPVLGVGTNGDFYLDTESMVVFGPKTLGGWGVGAPLKGPKGDKGDRGDPGEVFGNLPATRVTYGGSTLQVVLDDLLYVAPVVGNFAGSVSEAEMGSSVASQTFTWTMNKTIVDQMLDGITIDPTLRTMTLAGPFTTNKTWVLFVGDGKTNASRSYTLTFKYRRFWGTSSSPTLTDDAIKAMSGELATSRSKSVSYNASGGRYVYYCYPASFGAVSATVGGLAFSDFTVTTRDFVNHAGLAVSYNIVRFNSIQTGSNIQVDWS